MNRQGLFTGILLSLLLGGCSSLQDFMDSSHGPQGSSATVESAAPAGVKTAAAPKAQAQVSTTPAAQPVTAPQAGVVKPFAAYAQDAQSVEDELLSQTAPASGTVRSASSLTDSAAEVSTMTEAAGQSPAASPAGPRIIDITHQSENTALSSLTTDLTLSGHCTGDLNSKVQNSAQDLAVALAGKLQVDRGEIFVAPTVIPDEYQDCVSDAQLSIKNAFAQTANFQPSAISESSIYQNAGSSTVIPRLVRACRTKGVPYLCYTSLGQRGGKLRIMMRIIRISDGITLTQDYKNLE